MTFLSRSLLAAACVSCSCVIGLAAQLLGPSRYLCFDSNATSATGNCQDRDSPFKEERFEWFHLKDYEDQVLESPGVTMSAQCGDSSPPSGECPFLYTARFNGLAADSVDEDTGVINGLGQTVDPPGGPSRGESIYAHAPDGILFTFDAGILGDLPTHAGVVWTDGKGLVQFEAWDSGGNSLGTLQGDLEDGGPYGSTAEDRFFGVIHEGGISAIRIVTASAYIEVDHLQYGKLLPECLTGDGDGDGSPCPQDCNDLDPDVYPGAVEINDADDESCPGDLGYGLVDELLPQAGFDPLDPSKFCWPAQEGAKRYEWARSSRSLEGEITCAVADQKQTCVTDGEVPELGVVSYYVARALTPNPGSWGAGIERREGCVFEDCSDGLDNDQDGLTDCDDHDCAEQCMQTEFSFVNTPGDDVSNLVLLDFFGALVLDGSEYLLFSYAGGALGPSEICVARADFYRDAYIALRLNGGTNLVEFSGNWEKFYRNGGNPWVGPITESFGNYFSVGCDTSYSWCIEANMGGMVMMTSPVDETFSEGYSYPAGCLAGTETCVLTIRVEQTRQAACGF